MKISKAAKKNTTILIGSILFVWGMYDLGYHNGLEFLRKGDSGLGGFAGWGSAWIRIAAGLVILGAGLLIGIPDKS